MAFGARRHHGDRAARRRTAAAELADLLRREQVTHAFITPAALASVDPDGLDGAPGPRRRRRGLPAGTGGAVGAGPRACSTGTGPPRPPILANVSDPLAPGGAGHHRRPDPRLRRRWSSTPGCSPVPVGVAGELYLAGPGWPAATTTGSALTADASSPTRSASPGDRMYRTGDLVRWRRTGPALPRVPRPQRLPGQGPRLPHRTRRDRRRARRVTTAVGVRGDHRSHRTVAATRCSCRTCVPAEGAIGGARRGQCASRRDAPARAHGAVGDRGARRDPADPGGQARPQARCRCRSSVPRRGVSGPRHGHRGAVVGGASPRCSGSTGSAPTTASSTSAATRWSPPGCHRAARAARTARSRCSAMFLDPTPGGHRGRVDAESDVGSRSVDEALGVVIPLRAAG